MLAGLPEIPLFYEQANLGKASTSQERMERQLQILLANQIEISDALTFLESEVDHLERWTQNRIQFDAYLPGNMPDPTLFSSAQQKNKVVHPSLFPSQSLIYSLADKISVHLCNLGETFLAIYPLPRDRKVSDFYGFTKHCLTKFHQENDAPGSDVKGTIIPLTHEILINHLQALNLVEKRLGRNVIG
jgi:hypothetical protein